MENGEQRLTAYIDDILYHPERAALNPQQLPEEYRAIGESLLRLGKCVTDARDFAKAVADGDLAASAPRSGGVLADSVHRIQNRMSRMVAQVEDIVAQGGALKNAGSNFEDMVFELRKRTLALENERSLFIKFTESASERIVVLDEETGEIVYANKIAREFHDETASYIDSAYEINKQSRCSYTNPYSEWLHTVTPPEGAADAKPEYYKAHSIYVIWDKRGAIAHMFSNVTEQKEIERLAALALTDSLTGAGSRTCGMQYLAGLYEQDSAFALAFVDVDYLKYCNDTFGHLAGDEYLREVTALLRGVDGDATVCRTGGDEFMLISVRLGSEELRARVEQARQQLYAKHFTGSSVHKSFSYGIAARAPGDTATLKKLLGDADERMYKNKLENKKSNHMTVQDDRLR